MKPLNHIVEISEKSPEDLRILIVNQTPAKKTPANVGVKNSPTIGCKGSKTIFK